jgi:hypothetical protein
MVTNGRCVLSPPDIRYMDMSPYTTGFANQPKGRTATGYQVGGRITSGAFGAIHLDEGKQLATLGTFTTGACVMAGLTSDAPAAFMSQRPILSSMLRDKVPMVHQSASPDNLVIKAVDGGPIDHLGIYALLARKVPNIIMVAYIAQSLATGVSPSLSALFGQNTHTTSFMVPIGQTSQVFDSRLHDTVVSQLRDSTRAGTRTGVTTMHRMPVQGNEMHGIQAYTLQSLTIVYVGRDEAFLRGIPPETRDALLLDNPNFPHYPFLDVKAMSQLTFMSTVGSNGLARYAQYVGETYILPIMSSLQGSSLV